MELGQNAGKITWNAAVADEKREEWRANVRGFGAWDDDEIAAWSDQELNSLLIQFISGDIREFESLCGDDGNVYFYVGE